MAVEPLYQRVKREPVAAIESRGLPPDAPFVAQRKSCEQFGVGHATAVRSLNNLALRAA
jgi:GntR family transcriptional regulator of arabinose operon